MDRVEHYREILRRIVHEYAGYRPANGQIETEAVIDDERDHYEVIHAGWQGRRRVHGSVIHLDLKDGKVWIQHDGTSWPVAEQLAAAGIPREDIVLAFHPPDVRHLTGYAVGD